MNDQQSSRTTFIEATANGGSSYSQQVFFLKKQKELQSKIATDLGSSAKRFEKDYQAESEKILKTNKTLIEEKQQQWKLKIEKFVADHEQFMQKKKTEADQEWKQIEENLKQDMQNPNNWRLGNVESMIKQKTQEFQIKFAAFTKQKMELMAKIQQEFHQEFEKLSVESRIDTERFIQQLTLEYQQFKKNFEAKWEKEQRDFQERTKLASETLFDVPERFKHYSLTVEQKKHLVQKGFVKIPGIVSKELTQAALRVINATLAQGYSKAEMLTFRRPEVEASEAIVNLCYESPLLALIQSVVGKSHPCLGGQIAVRFPGFLCLESIVGGTTFTPLPNWEKNWHIDGFKVEGEPLKDSVRNFTCLFGVLLQDLDEPMSGNLTVFPGSHLQLEKAFKERGINNIVSGGLPSISLNPPEQITGKAGDVIVLHYQTAHSVAPNLSPNIRYAVYFRVYSIDHQPDTYRPEAMIDIWKDWKGITPSLAQH